MHYQHFPLMQFECYPNQRIFFVMAVARTTFEERGEGKPLKCRSRTMFYKLPATPHSALVIEVMNWTGGGATKPAASKWGTKTLIFKDDSRMGGGGWTNAITTK